MNLFNTSKEQKLYQQIATQIAEQIQQKKYLPGERLPSERMLAEKLDISRATVREAIIALEILGYVEIRMGAGIYVLDSPMLHADINIETSTRNEITPNEIIEIRLLVEPEFTELAALYATREDLESFKKLQAATERINSLNDHYYFDKKFHLLIAESTKNPLARNIMKQIWESAERSVMPTHFNKHYVTKRSWDLSVKEHQEIINAILVRDAKLARHMMYKHLTGVLLRLR